MAKLWTNPRQWEAGEQTTSDKMIEISDSMEWLKDRPLQTIALRDSSNLTVTMPTPTSVQYAVSDALLTLTVETAKANERVRFDARWEWSVNVAAGNQHGIDILMDDTTWVSSGTATPKTYGFYTVNSVVGSGVLQNLSFHKYFIVPTAGIHTFKLRMIAYIAQTVTLYCAANRELEFSVLDI